MGWFARRRSLAVLCALVAPMSSYRYPLRDFPARIDRVVAQREGTYSAPACFRPSSVGTNPHMVLI
jgi:hypothetical protein